MNGKRDRVARPLVPRRQETYVRKQEVDRPRNSSSGLREIILCGAILSGDDTL
jgi:hypothetical protein